LQTWYKHSGDRQPRPSRLDLQKVTKEYKTLYKSNPPSNDELDIWITPISVNDEITNDEIALAVRRLKNGKAPGQSGLRAEHLKTLLNKAEKKEATSDDQLGWEPRQDTDLTITSEVWCGQTNSAAINQLLEITHSRCATTRLPRWPIPIRTRNDAGAGISYPRRSLISL
jgi:hypothetical protein